MFTLIFIDPLKIDSFDKTNYSYLSISADINFLIKEALSYQQIFDSNNTWMGLEMIIYDKINDKILRYKDIEKLGVLI